ncbi:MAG: nitroreductase family protein [Bacteroidota bacterium]
MDKPAITNLEIHPNLKKRWSPRSFTHQPVEPDKLQRIFEAARWAPSSFNDQPWRFVVGRIGTNTWDMIHSTLTEFNQKWAKLAPVLGITIGKIISDKTGKPNRVYQYDLGQSIAYITFQATEEELYIHQMGGLDTQKAAEIFNVPEDYKVLTAFALGYKGEPELLEEDFMKMERSERQRHELSKIVFEGTFGEAAEFK